VITELRIECGTCRWGGSCCHPLKKEFNKNNSKFCLTKLEGKNVTTNHFKYPYKKVRGYYEYTYWEPKAEGLTCYGFLTDDDFVL